MDYIGTDFNSTGSVIPKSELTAARLKRGECPTCGRKCFKKKLFKMIPIDDEKVIAGRCLHCNPLHDGKNLSGHSSYNRSSSARSHSSNNNGRQPIQRSTTYHPTSSTRDIGSSLPARAMSSPPHSSHCPKDSIKTDTNHDRVDNKSTRTAASAISVKSIQSFDNDAKSRAQDLSSRTTRSLRSSWHSIDSSGSIDSASCSTVSHRSSSPSAASDKMEEIKRAAMVLMTAAQERGLGGALSLQDLVQIAESGATTTIATSDDEKDGGNQSPKSVEQSGILNRGGAVRCGRLIYAGSTRTLSSMSSIDEGDRSRPTTHIQFQQAIRAVGKSSRTLGSLSTIDGTNEEEMISQSGDVKKSATASDRAKVFVEMGAEIEQPSDSNPSCSSKEKGGESFVSVSLTGASAPVEKKIYDVFPEESKCFDTEIESILQKLRDSIDLSSAIHSMEAMKSLSEFLALFSDDSGAYLDLYVEKGLAGILVAVMRKYPESPEIQVKACDVLTTLVAPKSNHSMSSSNRRSQIIVEREGADEAILFSSMILHEDNPKVQEAALNTMRYLCKDSVENQIKFWKLDAIEPILRSMERHPKAARVQETGAVVVSMLASNPKNMNAKNAISEIGGVPVILAAISMHLEDSGVIEACFQALYSLVLDCPYTMLILLKTLGATKAILDTMQYHKQILAVQEIGCAILVQLTTLAEHTDLLLENGGSMGSPKHEDGEKPSDILESLIETILETIQNHSSVPVVQDLGFAILANLTDSDETKMFVVDLGVLDAIVLAMVLHKDHAGVQERVCGLLSLLAIRENHKHILAANPIELVKLAAHKYPEECREPASQLIRQLGLEPQKERRGQTKS